MKNFFALASLALLVTACGGGDVGTLGALARPAARDMLTVRIRVPRERRDGDRGARYISSATQGVTIALAGPHGFTVSETASLLPGATGCTGAPSATRCTLSIPALPPGAYTGSISTYGALAGCPNACAIPPNTKPLSANQALTFTMVTGTANTLSFTLAGIPARTVLSTSDAFAREVGVTNQYDLMGQGRRTFIVESFDASGERLVGVGTPVFTIGHPSGALSGVVVTPAATTTAAPNEFFVTSPAAYASGTATIAVTPSFAGQTTNGCALPGADCSPVTLTVDMEPLVYVSNNTSAGMTPLITAYDSEGNQQALSGSFAGMAEQTSIAYDSHNGWFYAANCDNGAGSATVTAYDANGNPQQFAGAGARFPNLDSPRGIAFDGANDRLYVVNSNASVTAYDENGNQETTSGGFPNVSGASGIIYVPDSAWFYIADCGGEAVTAYDANGTQQTLSGTFPNLAFPTGIAYDPSNTQLYVANFHNNTLTAYHSNGTPATLSGSGAGLNNPFGMAYDPKNGFMYVANRGNSTISAYDSSGNPQTLTGTFPGVDAPYSIAIVP